MGNPRVKIEGSQTVSQAANDAAQGLGGLADAANKAIDAAKGLIAFEVLKEIVRTVSECVTEYAEAEKALISLNAATQISLQVNGNASKGLEEYATKIAILTGNTKESVIQSEVFLMTAGRTEDQIKKIIMVASDMSVATGDTLDGAMRKINATFDGTAGKLTKQVSELRNLTKEQLENGAAVDVLARHYAGLSDAMSGSASVSLANSANAWKELGETAGEILNKYIQPIRDMITNIVEYIANHKEVVSGILNGIVLAADAALFALNPILGGIALLVTGVFELQQAMGGWKILWLEVELIALMVVKGILDAFSFLNNGVIDVMNTIITAYNKVLAILHKDPIPLIDQSNLAQSLGIVQQIANIKSTIDGARTESAYRPSGRVGAGVGSGTLGNPAFNTDAQHIMNADWDDYKAYLIQVDADKKERDDHLADLYKDFNSEMANAAAAQLAALEQIKAQTELAAQELQANQVAGGTKQIGQGALSSMSSTGAGGSIITTAITNIQQFGAEMGIIVTLVQPIIDSFFKTIGPTLEAVLQPIMGFLAIVGQMLGEIITPLLQPLANILLDFLPILLLLKPSMELLALQLRILMIPLNLLGEGFAWLYDKAILPFANAMIWCLDMVWNIFADIWNWLPGFIAPGHMDTRDYNSDKLQPLDASTLNAAGANGTTASGATYGQVRPVNINIVVNTDVIADSGSGFDALVMMISRRMGQLAANGVLS